MAFVPVGATCVGSVEMTLIEDEPFSKGDELGFFQFGGSTVVLVFPPDTVELDKDLLDHSARGIETYVEMGQTLGNYKAI